jgi:hypothetical protein
MKSGGADPLPRLSTPKRKYPVKKLLTLGLTCGMFAIVGCGDPPKPAKKDDVKKTPPAAATDDKKMEEKKMEEKKDDKKMEEKKPG